MIYSGTSQKFVLFGLLEPTGFLETPEAFYCPAETAESQSFNTAANPWPPSGSANVQGGYASYPFVDWGFVGRKEGDPPPVFADTPRIDLMDSDTPLLADGVGSPDRLDSRHANGVHALFADSAVRFVQRSVFDDTLETITGFNPSFNDAQQTIWDAIRDDR